MCASPSVSFDAFLRSAIQCITNNDLLDTQWIQASLPVRDGGLEVRCVSSLALPAYLASAASTRLLHTTSFVAACPQTILIFRLTDSDTVLDSLPTKQPFWDHLGILRDRSLVDASLQNPYSIVTASCL